jgi:NO-binding membrane sensor protein with MHYT domain
MYYSGIADMPMEADTMYNLLLFAISIAIAISASIVALSVAFQLLLKVIVEDVE